jgi:hypothetical protein
MGLSSGHASLPRDFTVAELIAGLLFAMQYGVMAI